MIDWKTVKEGQIIYKFGLRQFGGRVWELNLHKVKIIRINECSIRINYIDDNKGRGNEWASKREKLEEEAEFYFLTPKQSFNAHKASVKKYAKQAKKELEGYNKKHSEYEWYVYSKNIINDFSNLLQKGYTKEEYHKIKNKYKKFESEQFKKIFN